MVWNIRAFVPLWTRPPRPLLTAPWLGAMPPTDQMLLLACLGIWLALVTITLCQTLLQGSPFPLTKRKALDISRHISRCHDSPLYPFDSVMTNQGRSYSDLAFLLFELLLGKVAKVVV